MCNCLVGKAREKLKWADGKAIKSEIDMQVPLRLFSPTTLYHYLLHVIVYQTR